MNNVDKPLHYQTASGMQPIDVIEAFELGFNLGNAIKYILRAGKKDAKEQELQKAVWYIEREMDGEVVKVPAEGCSDGLESFEGLREFQQQFLKEYFFEGARFVITDATESAWDEGDYLTYIQGELRDSEGFLITYYAQGKALNTNGKWMFSFEPVEGT